MTETQTVIRQAADEISAIVNDAFTSAAEESKEGDRANVVDGLFAIARAINRFTDRLCGDMHSKGEIEPFGMHIGDKLDAVAGAIGEVAGAIAEDK